MAERNSVLKNSIALYIRMGVMMIVTLYSSRIVLDCLGVTDFGIYNVVGGVVVLASFVNNILKIAVRRFIAVEMVREKGNVLSVFRSGLVAVSILGFIVLAMLETVGLWFLNTHLNIPEDRMFVANIIYQLSIVTYLFNIFAIPYDSVIVAYERMNIYAYIGILEAFMRLGLALALQLDLHIDKLLLYGILMLGTAIIVRMLNATYCNRKLLKQREPWKVDKKILKSMMNYSSWSMVGAVIGLLSTQGLSMIFNIFYGVAINAAIGIAHQIQSAVSQFVSNFQTAFNPRLTKLYAADGLSENTFSFMLKVSKMVICLELLLAVPILVNIDSILDVWLTVVPENTAFITIILTLYFIIDGAACPLYVLVYAKGDVKFYQIFLSIINVAFIAVVYAFCRFGLQFVQVYPLYILCSAALYFARLYILKRIMNFDAVLYMRKVLLPLIPILVLLIGYSHLSYTIFEGCLLNLLVKAGLDLLVTLSLTFLIYLNSSERMFLKEIVMSKLKKS